MTSSRLPVGRQLSTALAWELETGDWKLATENARAIRNPARPADARGGAQEARGRIQHVFLRTGAAPALGDAKAASRRSSSAGTAITSRRPADRFRFQTLQARFQKFVELWDRGLRAREEGRPGPFAQPPPKAPPAKEQQDPSKVLYVTAFKDPMHEMDKLHSLYDTLMDARRQSWRRRRAVSPVSRRS